MKQPLTTFLVQSQPSMNKLLKYPYSSRNAIVKISDGFNDTVKSIRFTISMVQLVDLQLMDVEFSEIILDQTRTPNLQELFLHNVPDDCRMEILLPTLKKFKIFYYQG